MSKASRGPRDEIFQFDLGRLRRKTMFLSTRNVYFDASHCSSISAYENLITSNRRIAETSLLSRYRNVVPDASFVPLQNECSP